jgi:hypothetical protein
MNTAHDSLSSLSTIPPVAITEEWMADHMAAHTQSAQAELAHHLTQVNADNDDLFACNVKAQDALLTTRIGQEEQNQLDKLKSWQGRYEGQFNTAVAAARKEAMAELDKAKASLTADADAELLTFKHNLKV